MSPNVILNVLCSGVQITQSVQAAGVSLKLSNRLLCTNTHQTKLSAHHGCLLSVQQNVITVIARQSSVMRQSKVEVTWM